ncbi:threonyl-tRNA synthetase domain protein [Burkholderia pseudomallei MSHR7343]|nr:threonyl-tRNA synthetase domain protein [Burkholderia pseudomallei]KGS23079.1 threonyl-tRNA synthetase domain protein [Burkholderia pseudomallei MSHR7343]
MDALSGGRRSGLAHATALPRPIVRVAHAPRHARSTPPRPDASTRCRGPADPVLLRGLARRTFDPDGLRIGCDPACSPCVPCVPVSFPNVGGPSDLSNSPCDGRRRVIAIRPMEPDPAPPWPSAEIFTKANKLVPIISLSVDCAPSYPC